MSLLTPPRSTRLEMLDRPSEHVADLHQNLRDIRVLNRWFGGASLAVRCVRHLLSRSRITTVLDVATGSADIPLAIVARAQTKGIDVHVTAVDLFPEVLAEARAHIGQFPIAVVAADARRLPFENGSFDVVTCCLALHHFDPEDATTVLREMRRVARRAIVVTDLRRGYLGYVGAWLVTRTVARNQLTRHDGPLSVLRAYRLQEVRALACAAGLQRMTVRRRMFFRFSLEAQVGESCD